MSSDHVEFTISWQGGANARLHYIVDNDDVVKTEADRLEGNSPLACSYEVPSVAVHAIEWSLWFPGDTARKLVASVRVNGGLPVTLDVQDGEVKSKWASRGAAP